MNTPTFLTITGILALILGVSVMVGVNHKRFNCYTQAHELAVDAIEAQEDMAANVADDLTRILAGMQPTNLDQSLDTYHEQSERLDTLESDCS